MVLKRPVTRDALRMYDTAPADLAVVMAWCDPGVEPYYHKQMQQKLREQMPLLARSLDRMSREMNREP